jgi:hypothetical protein
MIDRVTAEAEIHQLRTRNHAVLAFDQRPDRLVMS